MKINYLFPHRYKKIGWAILIPSVILGLITLIFNYEPSFFDARVFTIWDEGIFEKTKILSFTTNNIFSEIIGILIIISSLMVAFSKEVHEDEFIAKIRLESLVWATYINYAILILGLFLVYGIGFYWVMIFNMFTILLIFIIRFNWAVYKLNATATYAE